jgi:transcriptional regulator with XRE-family HTH domain
MVRKALQRAFATEMRDIRNDLGLSQEELADRANLHRNYIGMIERLERVPTLTAMEGIAKGLKLRLSELILRAEQRVAS